MSKSLRPVWRIFAFLCAVVAVSLVFPALRPKEIIPWRTDLAAATAEAPIQQAGLRVLHRRLVRAVPGTQIHDVGRQVGRGGMRDYVPVKIDVDRRDDLAGEYHVPAVPAYIVLGTDGKPLRRTDGGLEPKDMLTWLRAQK